MEREQSSKEPRAMMLGKDCTPSARGDRSDSRKILKVPQRWGVERMARLDGRLRKEGVLHMRDMLSRRRGGLSSKSGLGLL